MRIKKCTGILLVLLLVCSFVNISFATSTIASVPVTLTVANEYRAVNVTVPANLPVEVINGEVFTADNVQITNNSETSAIRVTKISVTNGAYKVGSFENFAGATTIALKINGCPTVSAGCMDITSAAFPVIPANENLALTYYAKVSADAPNAEGVNAAHVVFTISLVD